MRASILLIFILFSSCQNHPKHKASLIAGYMNGSLSSTHFELFVDSTYLIDNGLSTLKGRWELMQDSFILYDNKGQIAASIYQLKPNIYNKEYRSLGAMRLKSFSPAKVVQFPKPN
jgi:hypothetical protein